MSDPADQAEAVEALDRAVALANQNAAAHRDDGVTPLHGPHGSRLCIVCLTPIDPARVAALPEALRCTWCQTTAEAAWGH